MLILHLVSLVTPFEPARNGGVVNSCEALHTTNIYKGYLPPRNCDHSVASFAFVSSSSACSSSFLVANSAE